MKLFCDKCNKNVAAEIHHGYEYEDYFICPICEHELNVPTGDNMTNIKDLFKVGDSVSWITVVHQGKTIDINKHFGIIDEVVGTEAMVKIVGKRNRKRVSLYEMETI